MMMRRSMLYISAGVVLLVFVTMLVGPRFADAVSRIVTSSTTYHGTLVDASEAPEEFPAPLASANGEVQLSDYRGQVVVMYFGYTHCPDFCPATLNKLTRVLNGLGEDAGDVQVIMVTVDPERDTAERLDEYMTSFDPSFVGLTGSEELIQEIASQFRIYIQKQDDNGASDYMVDHTTTLVVLQRDGRVRLYLGWDLSIEEIENDLANLVSQ